MIIPFLCSFKCM